MSKRNTASRAAPPPGPEPDALLAIAVHQRCDSAFERLVGRFETPLIRYAGTLLQSRPDAEEVVQDAMMRAHRALTVQYDEARCRALALRPWLFKMVRNLALNKRRGKRRQVEQPLDASLKRSLLSIGLDDVQLDRKRGLLRLQRAVDALPDEARELIALRFLEEMTYAEIAKTVGASEASLRGRVFRSLAILRQRLEKEGVPHAL